MIKFDKYKGSDMYYASYSLLKTVQMGPSWIKSNPHHVNLNVCVIVENRENNMIKDKYNIILLKYKYK